MKTFAYRTCAVLLVVAVVLSNLALVGLGFVLAGLVGAP